MVDTAAEPGVKVIVMMTATQVGKSTTINAILGWSISGEAGPHLLVRPDDSDAKAFVRENFDPLIAATPALRKIVGSGAKGLDSTVFKSFPGGSLAIVSSWKASALAGKAIRVLFADEVDRFAQIVSGGEGEPITLALRRLQTFRHSSLAILASSPTLKGSSRIAKHHDRGDQRKFFVSCRECKEWDDLTSDRLKFEAGRPETARLLCLCCGHEATEAERLDMLAYGEFRPTAKGEPGIVSFQMSELASEFSDLETIAKAVDSATTLEAKKVLVNTTWGLPYEATAEVELDASDLYTRAERIEPPYSASITFVTCGVDVQTDRLELVFLAQAPRERWLLNHIVLPGDTSGTKVWSDLDSVLGSTFRLKDGGLLPLSAIFIDAGFYTQAVVDFVVAQRLKQRKAWPIFGRAGFDRPAAKLGAKVRNLARGYTIGVDNVKLQVTKALAGSDPGLSPIRLPDHLDQQVFAQLTSERLEIRYVKGYPRHVWTKDAHTRNEALDCLVYASAAATTIREPAASLNSTDSKPSLAERMININVKTNEARHAHQS